jgi:Ala-tRNA(Pro) deacylase
VCDQTIVSGRPDIGSRSVKEESVYDFLDALQINYARADHNRAATMEDLDSVSQELECPIYKNLFLTNRQQTAFYLLVLPGEKPFKTKFLSKQLGVARLSFGSAEDMERLLGVTPGSASILALKNDPDQIVQLIFDNDIKKSPLFGCHPCENTTTLRLSLADILEKVLPTTGHTPVYVDLPWVLDE